MRRKLLAIVAMVCMVLSFAGCSTQAVSLMGKMKQAAAWQGNQETGSMSFEVAAGGETIGLTADYTAYTNTVDNQAEMTLNVKQVKASGVTIDTTKGEYKLSPIKLYISNTKAYMSTSAIKEICKFADEEASSVVDLSKDYVALDMADYLKQMGYDEKLLTAKSADEKYKASMAELSKLKVELPVKQNKDTYTIELNADQMIDLVFKMVNTSLEQNSAQLKAQYKAMGLTDAQIEEVLAAAKEVYGDETKAEAVKALKGSTAKAVIAFGKDQYTTKVDIAVKGNVEGETIAFNMTMNTTSKKAAKKAVQFPKNVKVYSMSDMMNTVAASASALVVTEDTAQTPATK